MTIEEIFEELGYPTTIWENAIGEEATAEEVIGLTLEGEGLEIAFNAAYLKDGLASVNAPTTRLSFTAASKPAVLSGVNSDGVNDETYRYLIMPVRLAG